MPTHTKTLAVNIVNTIGTRGSVKEAAARGWKAGRDPVRPAYRIVAHVNGDWKGEFTSASGGRVQDGRRFFDDLEDAEQTYPNDLRALLGSGRLPVRRLAEVKTKLEQLNEGLTRAFRAFTAQYSELGGHRFHGFTEHGDPRNYQGPLIWSEGDCQFRLALALEKEFPGMVHLEVPIAKFTVANYDPEVDKPQFVDIVVSDLSQFNPKRDVFAERPHDLFIEVKYAGHSGKKWRFVGERTIRSGVRSDLERLQRNLDLGRCRAAAMLIVDDNSYLESVAGTGMTWSPQVRALLASPTQLARRNLARSWRVALPECCGNCGSPRIAAVLIGLPSPEMESARSRQEVIIGGCETLGRGLDPTYGCLDCGANDGHPDPISVLHPEP